MKPQTYHKQNQKLAFISASWHEDIVSACKQAFLKTMSEHQFDLDQVESFEVPGSLEIPLTAQWLAETGNYTVILAAGFVVNGGIYRHEFVSQTVITGIMDVQLKTGVPILSAVLTPQNYHEHDDHHSFFIEHMKKKGAELANSCLKTLENLRRIKS